MSLEQFRMNDFKGEVGSITYLGRSYSMRGWLGQWNVCKHSLVACKRMVPEVHCLNS